MARDLRPKHKLCRRFGEKLCDSVKCPVKRRSYPPGIHGPQKKSNKKTSAYGKQLLEKQKVKRIYGLLERQFSNYVTEASRKKGDTSKFLVEMLESRLDTVVYRLGLASTRPAARQAVSHGHFMVNGRRVTIPSLRVKVGDLVELRDRSKKSPLFVSATDRLAKYEAPSWLDLDKKNLSGKILNAPTLVDANFNIKPIIEFYSR